MTLLRSAFFGRYCRSKPFVFDADVLDRARLEGAMKGQEVVYANLSGAMKQQAESIVGWTRPA